MNVSIRQLKYFLAVVRENSFSRAADACFISQSAISQQIHALETALGCELFARSNRRFSLTPAGEHFYRKALVLVADFDSARPETVRIAQGDASALSIGYLRTYSGCEFHRAIDRFAAEHPDVALSVAYGNHEELYAMLRSGSADVVLTLTNATGGSIAHSGATAQENANNTLISGAAVVTAIEGEEVTLRNTSGRSIVLEVVSGSTTDGVGASMTVVRLT